MYDIIGDIHGRAEALKRLLDTLGYHNGNNGYEHATRKAVFLGDFINKGRETKEVLEIVKGMVDHKAAYAVLGNHELYLIGFFTRNAQNEYIRPRTPENTIQHLPTFESFHEQEATLLTYIEWFKTLPLFLDFGLCRIAHAFWHQESINFLQQNYPQACLSDLLLHHLTPGSAEWRAVHELLVGLKLPLPTEGESFKAKWWLLGKTNRYEELSIRPDEAKKDITVSAQVNIVEYSYPENEIPFFFGHYNLPGKPYLIGSNYCCLDFSWPDQAIIPAYRWHGETTLDQAHFVF